MQAASPGTSGIPVKIKGQKDARTTLPLEVQIHVHVPCDAVADRLVEVFEAHGLRIYPSFDLKVALEQLPQCGCPYHGQDLCTCQYVVWLVYGSNAEPVLVVLHGRDGETWITLSANDIQKSQVYRILNTAMGDGQWIKT